MAKTDFEEKFSDVMNYAKLRLDAQGKRLKIRDKEDLREVFKRLDASRRDKKGDPRMNDVFINGLIDSRRAQKVIGTNIGRFGSKPQVLKRSETPKVKSYRSQGRTVYRYPKGYALKSTYYTKNKNLTVRFRDVNTGRFVKKDSIEEE